MKPRSNRPGLIKTSADAEARPLAPEESQEVFNRMAAKRDQIAFQYLRAGCESRAQLMIEHMEQMGIRPGRAWALSVGQELAVVDPLTAAGKIKWNNHVAPIVAAEGVSHGVLIIDPSLTRAGPMTIAEWTAAMGARCIEVVESPLTQLEILERQRKRVLGGEQPMDAVVFVLEHRQSPIAEIGGSGFRIGPDPAEGVSVFARQEQQKYLKLQQLRAGRA